MNKLTKISLLAAGLLIGAYLVIVLTPPKKISKPIKPHDASWDLMFQQNRVEKEGKVLEESLQFEAAKEKYKQAIEMGKRMTPRQDYWGPTFFYARVLQKEGKYEEALGKVARLVETMPTNERFFDTKKELEALVKSKESSSNLPIRQFIESFKEKYAAGIPPQGTGDMIRITTILRLYDAIADYDAGIAYVDVLAKLLKIEKEKRNEDAALYDRVKTSQQAEECAGLNKRPKDRGPDSMECKLILNFLRVREGFEQDKAEGRKSCISAKPGEICMGRATKALIASDYFTW